MKVCLKCKIVCKRRYDRVAISYLGFIKPYKHKVIHLLTHDKIQNLAIYKLNCEYFMYTLKEGANDAATVTPLLLSFR